MSEGTFPLAIVGCGPAGLAASIQAHRDGLEHRVMGDEPAGGLVPAAWRIDNLPGHPAVTGEKLAERLAEQASRLDLPLVEDRVTAIERRGRGYRLLTSGGRTVPALAVILATGTRAARWHVPGTEEVAAGGALHRDVRSLPHRLEGLEVGIVGGGDAALDSALSVVRRGASATLLVRSRTPNANARLVERVQRRGVALCTATAVESLDVAQGRVRLGGAGMTVDHLMVCVGRAPRDDLYRMLVPDGPLPSTVATPLPGLYLAGDVIAGRDRFIARAMGDGQRAALLAARP